MEQPLTVVYISGICINKNFQKCAFLVINNNTIECNYHKANGFKVKGHFFEIFPFLKLDQLKLILKGETFCTPEKKRFL